MISLASYAKIKDKYCLCYYGPCEEYLLQLKLLKPVIERSFPGLKISFGCRDEHFYIFGEDHDVMKISEIKVKRENYAHVGEVRYDGQSHPVLSLLESCGIKNFAIPRLSMADNTSKCVIVTKGTYPTKNLDVGQIERLKKIARDEGYESELDGNIKNASLVMGVESYKLFEAAYLGSKVRLVPTGIGTRLYKLCFPDIELLHT